MAAPFSAPEAKGYLERFLGCQLPDEVDLSLEDAWYETGECDFSLYGKEEYLNYLLKAHIESRDHAYLAVQFLKRFGIEPQSLIDTGCGLGFFGALMATEFPNCRVVATNLPGRQFEFNTWLYQELGLPNLEIRIATEVAEHFDFVLSLEYFEHYKEPDQEVARMVEVYKPNYLIESSSFTHRGLGHFSTYNMGGTPYAGPHDKKGAGPAFRQFTKCLKSAGFERIPLKKDKWNHSRPRLWKRVEEEAPLPGDDVLEMFGV